MLAFVLRRLIQAVIVMVTVAFIAFMLFQYVGDPVGNMLGQDATPAQRQQLRADLGLDQPVVVQFVRFAANALRGEFGISLRQGRKVSTLLAERFPATLELAVMAAVLALAMGIPLGVYAALRRGTWPSQLVMAGSLLGVSLPNFWLGLMMIVLGTASSDAVLPALMRKLEALGVGRSTVGLVMPTGYSFNLDGFSIYLTLAAVFIAQATNTPISMADLLTILAISLVTSKGAHGVPGSAIVVLAATLQAIPAIPAIGLVLVLSVDWFMGIARALGNLIGNCVATVAVAAWEGDIDKERAHAVLNGKLDEEIAGALMSIGGAVVAFIGISVIFFNWSKTEG